MESDANVMSELGIDISDDDDDQVTTPKSRGRPTSKVWIHFDQVTRKGQTKPTRAKCKYCKKSINGRVGMGLVP